MQPLWRLYAGHFQAGGAPGGPVAPQALAEARAKSASTPCRRAPTASPSARPGMALTLNGIAQGWITDRIVDRLRAAGVTSTLVDMGEIRGLGTWRVGIAGTDAVLALTDRAVATSAPQGFAFDPAGRFTHIIDPRTGATPARYARVTVTAPTAAAADALSTGFALMDQAAIPAGGRRRWSSPRMRRG